LARDTIVFWIGQKICNQRDMQFAIIVAFHFHTSDTESKVM